MKGQEAKEFIPDEYLFVYDGCWWLKLTTADQIADYHQKTNNRYAGAMDMYWKAKKEGKGIEYYAELPLQERIELMQNKDFKYLQCAIIQAQKIGGTILDGFRCLNIEIGMSEFEDIRQYGAVFINAAGGHTHDIEYTQFCRRKELVFPSFKIEDIRVKQFKGGQHWYAYIGDMQLRNGDQLKWNTQEAAQRAAEAMVEV